MKLEDPITVVKGVGSKTAELFEKIGVYSISDMLLYFPRTFLEFPDPVENGLFKVGNECAIRAEIISRPIVKKGKIPVVITNVTDGVTDIKLIWFRSVYIASQLKPGSSRIFYGTVVSKDGIFTMEQPRMFSEEDYVNLQKNMQPVYPLVLGLKNNTVRKTVKYILEDDGIKESLDEILPYDIVKKYGFNSIKKTYESMHFPKSKRNFADARKRLVYQEFLAFSLRLKYERSLEDDRGNGISVKNVDDIRRLEDTLPFKLTNSQKSTLDDIFNDISKEHTMRRIIQGDVGSGKTIVAFFAMAAFASNGYSSAIMAPTAVLAAQHYDSLCEFLKMTGLPYEAVLLTGSLSEKQKKDAREKLERKSPVLAVGTQALIQDKVKFKNLGLAVTDEQHRFGVRQRMNLSEKGNDTHMLYMSATPIPRTLSMILYGDLSISDMKDMPKGRLPIKTAVIDDSQRKKAYQLMMREINEGRQAYIICPLVEESELTEARDTFTYTKELKSILPSYVKIDMLHGKMSPSEKNTVMHRFARGKTDVLVSTTVVEVGVNVPNATVIMIENAERFGLSQLHQLRGRVGRGSAQSYCMLVNGSTDPKAQERLNIMHESSDGFYISEKDLALRGPGDYFGIRQSGDPSFKLADIYADSSILKDAAADAQRIVETAPDSVSELLLKLKYRVQP